MGMKRVIPLCGPKGAFRIPGDGRLYVCQGCGKEERENYLPHKPITKPPGWFWKAGGGAHGSLFCPRCGSQQSQSEGHVK